VLQWRAMAVNPGMDPGQQDNAPEWIAARFGRGSRYVLAGLVLAAVALIALWAWAEVGAAWVGGHRLRAGGSLIVAVLMVVVALRLLLVNWRGSARAPTSSTSVTGSGADDDSDYGQTGVWGVGGPSVREPGNTVVLAPRMKVGSR
jgi:hypothetical protein